MRGARGRGTPVRTIGPFRPVARSPVRSGTIALLAACAVLILSPLPQIALPLEWGAGGSMSIGGARFAGNSSPFGNTSLNRTAQRIPAAIDSFVAWFVPTLVLVIGFALGCLLVGGVVNHLLVGRRRGHWTPADSVPNGPPSTEPLPGDASAAPSKDPDHR